MRTNNIAGVKNRREKETDRMPAEVATQLLLAPGRLTNRQCKQYWQARSKVFESTLEQRSIEEKFICKMKAASWAQLCRWKKRGERNDSLVESACAKALKERHRLSTLDAEQSLRAGTLDWEQKKIVFLDRLIAGLEIKRAQFMLLIAAVNSEVERRRQFVIFLRGVSKSIATGVEKKLCPR